MTFSITINKAQHSAMLCRVLFMPSVANKLFMLSVSMLNAVMLSVVGQHELTTQKSE
jgi:hypothetical protein